MNLRLPNLDGANDSVKLAKIQDYLYDLVSQLNFVLLDMERGRADIVLSASSSVTGEKKEKEELPEDLFATLKPYIIKNADIIASYSDEINKVLKGEYVAKTDFAEYSKTTSSEIKATSDRIEQNYSNVQKIEGSFMPGVDTAIVKTTNATITTGFVGYDDLGNAQYGMKIATVTDNKVFASAKFLSTGVIIYDENGKEALIITDETIIAKNIEVTTSFTLGGMRSTVSGLVITGKWMG